MQLLPPSMPSYHNINGKGSLSYQHKQNDKTFGKESSHRFLHSKDGTFIVPQKNSVLCQNLKKCKMVKSTFRLHLDGNLLMAKYLIYIFRFTDFKESIGTKITKIGWNSNKLDKSLKASRNFVGLMYSKFSRFSKLQPILVILVPIDS